MVYEKIISSLTDKKWKQPNKINLHSLCHTHTRTLAIEHFVVSVGDHHIRIPSTIQGENKVRKQYFSEQ